MKSLLQRLMYAQWGSSQGVYSRVEEGKASLEAEEADSRPLARFSSLPSRTELMSRFICVLMFIGGALMLSIAGGEQKSDRACAAQLSMWSPVLDAVEYEEREWVSIFSTHSDFIGHPTVELEERWHKLINMPAVLVPPERLTSLNRSIEQGFVEAHAQAPHGYIAGVEVFHHLHCLNVVRQFAWRDQYPEGLIPTLLKYNTPAVARGHVDHCIETLRQALTCNADLTPYLWYKSASHDGGPAKEDFQATHKCKRFDRIVDWVHANGVDVPKEAITGKVKV